MSHVPAADFRPIERLLLVLAALTLVIVAGLVARQHALKEVHSAFEKDVHSAELQISRQLAQGTTLVSALHGLLQGTHRSAQSHLPEIARRIVAAHPQALWVGQAVHVTPSEREALERRLDSEGAVDLRVRTLESTDAAAEPSAGHLAISTIEPLRPRRTRLLGADLTTVSAWRQALQEAIDSGEVRVVKASGAHLGRPGFLLLRATYRGNAEPTSLQDRRRQLSGMVLAFLDHEALLSRVRLSDPTASLSFLARRHQPVVPPTHSRAEHSSALLHALQHAWRPHHAMTMALPFAGTTVFMHLRARPQMPMGGVVANMLVATLSAVLLIHGLRMRRKARYDEHLAQGQARLAQVTLHSIGEAVVRLDHDGFVRYMNPSAERMAGVVASDASGRRLSDVFPLDGELVEDAHALQALSDSHAPMVLHAPDGAPRAVSCTLSSVDPEGGEAGRVLVMRDVTRERELSRELAYQASHDPLTDLPNRREFERRLEHAVTDSRNSGICHSLCYVDLDQFKIVNDTCGHFAGDRLLRQIAGLMGADLRDEDLLARLGGDEFGVLLRGCTVDEAMVIAERICRQVAGFRFEWNGRTFDIGASIGVVEITPNAPTVDELQRAADLACYAAKETGRSRVHRYGHEDHVISRNQREMRWHSQLREALEQDRFELHSQIIQPLRDGTTVRVMEELLLRLTDAEGNVVPPMSFLPAAERYGLMARLDRMVIDKALALAAPRAHEEHVFTINLSGQSLSDSELGTFVLESAKRHDIEPKGVCFEITETAAISNLSHAIALMEKLRTAGFRFALDDFGAGVSSFGYLKQLPVDYLKIDGQFVRDIGTDPVARVIVSSVISVARVLRLETVAEKVEDEAARRCLETLGADYVQGHLVGRPQPFAKVPTQVLARSA
jgi:diguanylate cyclase (GGDEF)-like protein/PAS domain S-box-containing protein